METSDTSRRTRRNGSKQAVRKSSRILHTLSEDSLLLPDSDKPVIEQNTHVMSVWVKEEVILEAEEEVANAEGSSKLIEIESAQNNTECHNNDESTTNSLFADPEPVIKGEHSSEYVLPDNISTVNESSKIRFLEEQLEKSKARNLELEKIVKKQKKEIEQLRKQKCECRANGSVKGGTNTKVKIELVR